MGYEYLAIYHHAHIAPMPHLSFYTVSTKISPYLFLLQRLKKCKGLSLRFPYSSTLWGVGKAAHHYNPRYFMLVGITVIY